MQRDVCEGHEHVGVSESHAYSRTRAHGMLAARWVHAADPHSMHLLDDEEFPSLTAHLETSIRPGPRRPLQTLTSASSDPQLEAAGSLQPDQHVGTPTAAAAGTQLRSGCASGRPTAALCQLQAWKTYTDHVQVQICQLWPACRFSGQHQQGQCSHQHVAACICCVLCIHCT